MVKEAKYLVRSLSQSGKSTIEMMTNFLNFIRPQVLEPLFHIAMTIFFRIHLRCVRWQLFHMNVWVVPQVGRHTFRPMGTRLIPNYNAGSWEVMPKMFQTSNDVFGFDRAFEVALVNVAGNG